MDQLQSWHEERQTGIGGSDVGAIVGVDQYRSPIDLYAEKIGMRLPPVQSIPMMVGNMLEPLVADLYSEQTGAELVQDLRIKRHPEHPFMIGHIDRFIKAGGILECKTAGLRSAHLWGDQGGEGDRIPANYELQVQHYLAVTGEPFADVAVLIGNSDFRVYRVERSAKAIESIIKIEADFWDRVQRKEPPLIDFASPETMAALFPADTGEVIASTPEVDAEVLQLKNLRIEIDALEDQRNSIQNRLKGYIGDSSTLVGEGYKIHWKKSKDRQKIDYEAICRRLTVPVELVARHTVTMPGTRAFRMYWKGEKDA